MHVLTALCSAAAYVSSLAKCFAKQELLQQLINNRGSEDKKCDEGSSKEKEAAPPPKKKKRSKEAKQKWISFCRRFFR